jgi:hypothetical protein
VVVPKYTSYELAPLHAPQLSAEVVETPVAPLVGEGVAGVDGADDCDWAVVKDQIGEEADPVEFLATTRQ